MEGNNRAEAERLLGIAEKLLQTNDFNGSRDFALLAQENDPLLEGSDQILAVAEVLLAAQRRINNHHQDWYAILQIDRRCDDIDLIKKQYRRLALLLHPDKNKFAFADTAFKLVADAWAVLSNSSKKSFFDGELGVFSKVDLVPSRKQKESQHQHHHPQPDFNQHKLPVRRGNWANATGNRPSETPAAAESETGSYWTACPYCYNLYEYPRAYDGCCLRCQNCERAFTSIEIKTLPPVIPGKEAYYCCWGFFPMGFTVGEPENGKNQGIPESMPPPQPPPPRPAAPPQPAPPVAISPAVAVNGGPVAGVGESFVNVPVRKNLAKSDSGTRKRGRPKKNLQA